jgi:hypothetical protein
MQELMRQELSRDPFDGIARGLRKFSAEGTNAAAQMEGVFTKAFDGMTDALTDFVMTGKLSFNDLANSIIRDMIRIAVQQSITGPLASGIKSLIGGLFTSGSAPVEMPGGGYDYSKYGVAEVFHAHSGGIAGQSIRITRNVPMSLFENAPRFHGGGYLSPGEIPIIAQYGERVLTREQNRDWERNMAARAVMAAPVIQVNPVVINNTGKDVQAETNVTPNNSGGINMEVILTQIEQGMVKRDVSGKSAFGNHLDKTRGLSRAGSLYR